MAQTVPVPPARTVGIPSSGRIASAQAAAASVFQTTVTDCRVSSCR